MAADPDQLTKPINFEPLVTSIINARERARCDGPVEWFQPGPQGVRYALFGVKPGSRELFDKPLMEVLKRFD